MTYCKCFDNSCNHHQCIAICSCAAPVLNFFNPDPGRAILQIWESDSCSDSCYNHRSNRNLPMFLLKKWPHRLLLLPKLKSDTGSGFSKYLTPDPGPKENLRIPPETTPIIRILCHLCKADNHALSEFLHLSRDK